MAEFSEVIKQRMRMCEKYTKDCRCSYDCPVRKARENKATCGSFMFLNPEEAEALIMDWAKEHPMQTNADKFKEVFGYEARKVTTCHGIKCIHSHDSTRCVDCECFNFWNQEYKEPKE